jgi:phytoene dehydrogenase-like protein
MAKTFAYDAIVVGSGPNGLAAAITMAQQRKSVAVFEANETIGGGARSSELTLPGFVHDLCSAVYPLAIGSPFFRSLPLQRYGLEWVQPPAPLAHPFDDGSAIVLERSLEATASGLGVDAGPYNKLMGPAVAAWNGLDADLLRPIHWPSHPWAFARFGFRAIQPARRLAEKQFHGGRARGLFAGLAAHSMLSLEHWASAGFGLVLGITAHALGWPIARGGAQKLSDALGSHLRDLGGEIFTGRRIAALDELPPARSILCDVTPRQLVQLSGARLATGYRAKLARYRYGMAAFKMDWALSAPVPWRAAECARAATVHLGGSLEEIAASEGAAWSGKHTDTPFVLLVQPSLFDPTRAPKGKHTLWAYCHIPQGSTVDMTAAIEKQIERFAPGFGHVILARHAMPPAELERRNANLVGGDINGGAADLSQLFLRPTARFYRTSAEGLYICSASTPPGGGVHGMCGHLAAKVALNEAK